MDAQPRRLIETFRQKLTSDDLENLIFCMSEVDNYLYELLCTEFCMHYPERAREIFVGGPLPSHKDDIAPSALAT